MKDHSASPHLFTLHQLGADVVKNSAISHSKELLLKQLGMGVGKKLDIPLGEVLFFVADQQITFGAATTQIIAAQHAPHFKDLTLQTLITPTTHRNLTNKNTSITNSNKTTGPFVAIGSYQDVTIQTLVKSQTFSYKRLFYR